MRFPYFNLISTDQIQNLIVITIRYCNFINSLTFISNDNQNQNQVNSTLDLIYILKYHSCEHRNKIFAKTTSKISASSLKYVYLLRFDVIKLLCKIFCQDTMIHKGILFFLVLK